MIGAFHVKCLPSYMISLWLYDKLINTNEISQEFLSIDPYLLKAVVLSKLDHDNWRKWIIGFTQIGKIKIYSQICTFLWCMMSVYFIYYEYGTSNKGT